jgi:hypothetical protein
MKVHLLKLLVFNGLFLLFGISENLAAQPGWSYINTGNNAVLLIQGTSPILVDGQPAQIGDYIGVFYSDISGNLECGGYGVYNGGMMSVTAWGDDIYTPVKDGFDTNEQIKYMIWSAASNLISPALATYQSGPNLLEGDFMVNGMMFLTSLIAQPWLIPDITGASCNGLSDGAVTVNTNFGQTPYTFLWGGGETTQSLLNIPAGSYSITVTEGNGLTASLSFSVIEPVLLVQNVLISESNAFQCLASAQSFPFGGTSPYTFQWDDPLNQSTSLASALCPGVYQIHISDANNCQIDTTIVIGTTSPGVTDSAFNFVDTCLNIPGLDTAYISDISYTAGGMIIIWALEFGGNVFLLDIPYSNINTPGVYYVSLIVNCPTKEGNSFQLVVILEITEDDLVRITEVRKPEVINIFPNPAANRIFVRYPGVSKGLNVLSVFDISGILVFEESFFSNGDVMTKEVNTSGWGPGIYMIQVSDESTIRAVHKFVIGGL